MVLAEIHRAVRAAAGLYGCRVRDRRTRCQCGARGCWQTVLGVRALAATLGEPETVDPREFAHHVLALATQDSRAGERAAELVQE